MAKVIDERSLRLSPYEYFQYCNKKRQIRGAAVITDKQYIFYSQLLNGDYGTHNDIEIKIENAIHPHNQKFGWEAYNSNHAYMASVGKELIICMPENGVLTLAQAKFMSDILDQTNKFNLEQVDENKKINIVFFDTSKNESVSDTKDVDLLKQKIKKRVTKNILIEEEEIIGTTLTKEEIKDNLRTDLAIKDCTNLKEVKVKINQCFIYLNDNYYKEFFHELFPDYQEVKQLINILPDPFLEKEKISNIDFNTLKEYLYSSIKTIFKYYNSYDELYQTFCCFDKLEAIEKIFPNFKYIKKIFSDIYPTNKEDDHINSLLQKVSNYEDFIQVVCNIAYNKKRSKLLENENLLETKKQVLEEINIENNIIASKDTLNQMIERKSEIVKLIGNYHSELEKNNFLIEHETNFQNNKLDNIQSYSKNFLKRLINRKKIKKDTSELNNSKLRSQKLNGKREGQLKQIEILEKEMKSIEKAFKNITHFNYFPLDTSLMEFYYTKDNSKYEKLITEHITSLKKMIEKIKQELTELTATGLITLDTQEVEDIEEYTEPTSNKRHH